MQRVALSAKSHGVPVSPGDAVAQVCNHPDLFEGRPIVSSFDMLPGVVVRVPSLVMTGVARPAMESVDLEAAGLALTGGPGPGAGHNTACTRMSLPPLM